MTGRWRFFSKPAVGPVQSPESRHWIEVAQFLALEVGNAAIPATGVSLIKRPTNCSICGRGGPSRSYGGSSQSDSLHSVTQITQIRISFTNLTLSELPWLQWTCNRL